jgi:hypothetical protein
VNEYFCDDGVLQASYSSVVIGVKNFIISLSGDVKFCETPKFNIKKYLLVEQDKTMHKR